MVLTILGSGTSTGVPLIHCSCAVCRSRNPKNKRLRASAWIRVGGKSLLIDTGPDFRQQALREKIPRIDAVLYTHPHADHCHGIDELRSFNYVQREPIPLYGNRWTTEELRHKFAYVFKPSYEGGGTPNLLMNEFDPAVESIGIQGVSVQPIALHHGSKQSIGYRIGSVAYVTDCSYIPPDSLERLKGLSVLILDCIRLEPHGTHLNLAGALEIISQVRPRKTFLTHLGHEFDYATWSIRGAKRKLPAGVHLAYDGLKVSIRD